MENLFGIEMRAQSRYELAALPEPPRCIFGDITDAIRADFRAASRSNAAKMRYIDLERIFRSPNILADVIYGVLRCAWRWPSTLPREEADNALGQHTLRVVQQTGHHS